MPGLNRRALNGLNPDSILEQSRPVALKEGRRPAIVASEIVSRSAPGISDADLVRIVNKTGNALAAIKKEVELERLSALEKSISKKESAALA